MKLQELIVLLRKEYKSRNLKCNARYSALNNVAGYIHDKFGDDLNVLNKPKETFREMYKAYKSSIGMKMSDAEKSVINEMYKQCGLTYHSTNSFHAIADFPIRVDSAPDSSCASLDDFMKSSNFTKVSALCPERIPQSSGLYAIRIENLDVLPEPFKSELIHRNHNLLYVGKASSNLFERLWREELHHHKAATFFRSIGVVLGYKPERCSLKNKETNNFKFNASDTKEIIRWIENNLSVNYIAQANSLDDLEKNLIKSYKPIINIQNNPFKMEVLSTLRHEALMWAKDL